MTGPRDPVPRSGTLINIDTGLEVSDRQKLRLDKIDAASAALLLTMHESEGSNPPSSKLMSHEWTTKRMQQAANLIEQAVMVAKREALESP